MEENKSFLEKVQLGELLCGIPQDSSVFAPATLAALTSGVGAPAAVNGAAANFGLNGGDVTASTEALLQALMQPPPDIWDDSSDDEGDVVDVLAARLGLAPSAAPAVQSGATTSAMSAAISAIQPAVPSAPPALAQTAALPSAQSTSSSTSKRTGVHWQEPECDDPAVASSKNKQQQQQQLHEQRRKLQEQLQQLQDQLDGPPPPKPSSLKTSLISNPSSSTQTPNKKETMVNGDGEVSLLEASSKTASLDAFERRRRKLPELPKDRRRKLCCSILS